MSGLSFYNFAEPLRNNMAQPAQPTPAPQAGVLNSMGVGRFLPGGIPQFNPQTQAPQMPAQGQAFQPNYGLFFNPYTMLQMGQPSFGDPWYTSINIPGLGAPPAAPPQAQGLSNQMQDWQRLARIAVDYQNPDVPGNRTYSLQKSCAAGVDDACSMLYGR